MWSCSAARSSRDGETRTLWASLRVAAVVLSPYLLTGGIAMRDLIRNRAQRHALLRDRGEAGTAAPAGWR